MDVKFLRGLKANLDTVAVVAGQILFTTDTKEMFIDTPDGRIEIADTQALASALAQYQTSNDAAVKKVGDDLAAHIEVSDAAFEEVTGNLADLVALVGTLPTTTTAATIVAYIDEKTAGIATEGALVELGNRVTEAETKIGALETDAEKHADKTYVDEELAKKADKTALAETDATLAEVKATVDNFFADDAAVNDTIDTLKEIAQYIANDKEGAADLTARVGALETKVDVEKVSTAIGVETTRATEAEAALGNRIKDLEDNKAGYATTGQVATAKQEAIDAAAGDATAKANAAQSAAEEKAAELDTALHTAISAEIDADVKALADGAVKTNADDIAAIKEALTWGTF